MAKTEELKYEYVEAWHSDGEIRAKNWKRIHVSEVSKYQQEVANNYNVFSTIQRFHNPVKVKNEKFISPLYFDIDSEGAEFSQEDAIKLVNFFTKELDCQPQDMRLYYSGSKGFHLLINEIVLGIEPSNVLHKVMKNIASYLIHRLDLKSLDLVVYNSSRMLRRVNSVHGKSKLFKIPLTLEEIHTLSLAEIKALAATPRELKPVGDPMPRPKAQHFYKDKLQECLEALATATTRYDRTEYNFTKGIYPECVHDLLQGGWKAEGQRNAATVQLASFFREAGYTAEEALAVLEPWVVVHTSATGGYQKDQRVANTRSVVSAIYSKDNEYKFGCAFIRSLHGDKKPGQKDYERVACAGDNCQCLAENDEQEEVPLYPLSQTGNAELNGKLVKTRVMIAGKRQTPFIIPKRIEYFCWGWKTCKKVTCPLHDLPTHTLYKNLGGKNRELIQMTASTDDANMTVLRNLSEIPSCQRYNIEILETVNIDELLVIPMAEQDETDIDKAGRYVLRRIYSLGELRINENKYYEITGFVYPHPKNQESTILLKSAKPLQDVVESFVLTEEIKEQLKIFRPDNTDERVYNNVSEGDRPVDRTVPTGISAGRGDAEGNSLRYTPAAIDQRIASLCNDLTYNVTHIVERDETLLGVLLVQHSVLRLSVPWDTAPIRGWLELMVLGDTGTGKSALIEKILRFVGLGTRVNAEATSRTGLTYKMEQSGPGGAWYIVWGAWPLADKEIIWIDEATGLGREQYGEMTMARSDGKLEVKKAVTAETPCRVRAILSSNVMSTKSIKRIADYAHGAEALRDIFNDEDIRRFDFGVFMKTTDVDLEKYNKILGTFPRTVTAETLKNNVLFAWSRTPEQVKFAEDTIDTILEVSTRLSKLYGRAAEVPLVSPSDERNKITRLSAALAALTHSVDEKGENIIVYPGHVEYIEAYLKTCFNSPGCGLNFLAQLSVRDGELTEKGFNKLESKLRDLPVLKGDGLYKEFINLFAKQKYLAVRDVEELLNITKEQAKALSTLLSRLNMVTRTTGGLRKTPLFNSFIQRCFANGMFIDEEEDE